MLKYGEANALAVFGLRRLEHCPPHFAAIRFDIAVPEKEISDWIYEHLTGRFYLGDEYSQTAHGAGHKAIAVQKLAGFEIPGEASMFALQLDLINQNDMW